MPQTCRHALLERPDASVAVPETIIHEADGSTRPARGAAPMDGRTALRLARYLARPADNSRFYGMYRTDAVRRSFPQDLVEAPAADWVISALSLVQGVHVRARGGRLHRTGSPPERYARSARARAVSPVHRLLPTASATRDLLRRLPPILRLTSIPSLLVMASHQALWHGWLTLRAKRA